MACLSWFLDIPVAACHIAGRKKRLSLEANTLFLEKTSASLIASTIALVNLSITVCIVFALEPLRPQMHFGRAYFS